MKNKNLLLLVLLNPVVSLVLFNTIRASINYVSDRPTLIETCCCAGWEPSSKNKTVYIEYFDDDCGDWEGCYYYTLDINNGVTEGLIAMFGNPIMHALESSLIKSDK